MAQEKKIKAPKLPAGWVEARTNLAGFFALIPPGADKRAPDGNTVMGKLRGSFNVKSKFNKDGKKVYRLEIVEGSCLVESNDEVVEAGEGEIIGLDERGFLKKLSDYEDGQPVLVRYLGKGVHGHKGAAGQQDPHVFQVAVPGQGE